MSNHASTPTNPFALRVFVNVSLKMNKLLYFHLKNRLSFIFPFFAACEKPNILCKSKGHNVCVLADFICDDSYECEDGEDEKHCVHEGTDKECYGNQFACGSIGSNHKECIEAANVCDGKEDCPDGSDEMTEECGTNK